MLSAVAISSNPRWRASIHFISVRLTTRRKIIDVFARWSTDVYYRRSLDGASVSAERVVDVRKSDGFVVYEEDCAAVMIGRCRRSRGGFG